MNKSIRIVFPLALLALLAGCGAKGPLFLPEKPPAPEQVEGEAAEPVAAPEQTDVEETPADKQAEDAVDDPIQPTGND